VQISELCLKMILEYRPLLELTRIVARTAENNQHVTFFQASCWLQRLNNYLKICRPRNFV